MATHSSILAWEIPWTESLYSPWGHKEADTTERLIYTHKHTYTENPQLHILCCRTNSCLGISDGL